MDYNPILYKIIGLLYLVLLLIACAGHAPVQELSNARQTLHLARDAKAQIYAQKSYAKAQEILAQAVNQLNSGEYSKAKTLALQATHEAKQAHLMALKSTESRMATH